MDLHKMTAVEAAQAVASKQISARELIKAFLSRCVAGNAALNSFIHILEREALIQADAVDELIRQGKEPLPLAGVPVAVKDDLCYREAPTTWGAGALKNFRPPCNAAAVQRLIDAGAVIVGKANLDQFGMGPGAATSFAGPAANPWNRGRLAGDGAAAAVAAGQCLLGLSSDTGGSLRAGASHCGIIGLRPGTGLVSRYGLNTFAPSFAEVALAARNARDAGAALQLISGYDPRDSATAASRDVLPGTGDTAAPEEPAIGYPAAVFETLDAQLRAVLETAMESYTAAGATLVGISLPLFAEALQAYYVIVQAEASSNLGRFDGVRFGVTGEGDNLEEWYCKTRAGTFGREAKRRSVIGAHLLSKDNFDRYYRQARRVWGMVRKDFAAALEKCDLVALPAVSAPAGPPDGPADFLELYLEDRFSAPVSLSGLPALCVPAGEVETLPVGLQLVGRPFGEAALLNLAGLLAGDSKLPPPAAF